MSLYILSDLLVLCLYVSRQVQVIVVFLYLVIRHKAGIVRANVVGIVAALLPDIRNALDVLFAQPVLGSILGIALIGIDHKDALALRGMCLVYHDDAGRDACAEEQIARQADDTFDVVMLHDILSDVCLGIAPEQHAVRQYAGPHAGMIERLDDM